MLNEVDFNLVQADLRKNRVDPNPPKPGIVHQLRNFLGIAPLGYFANRELFLDLNTIHQKVNWAALKNRPNLAGVMDKAGEVDDTQGPDSWLNPNFSGSCQGAYEAGKSFSAFIFSHCGADWINKQFTQKGVNDIFDKATTDTQRMSNMLHITNGIPDFPEFYLIVRQWAIGDGWLTTPEWLKTAKFRKIDRWVIDIERWWRFYNEYLDYLRGNRTQAQVKVIDAPWIQFSPANLQERLVWAMNHGYLPAAQVEIVDYSGKWFINQYSPNNLPAFLEKQSTWPAIWYWNAGAVSTTIEDLVNVQLAAIPDSWKDSANYKAAIFGLTPRWLQISGDRFRIPEVTTSTGQPTAVDVDVYIGPGDAKTWLGIPSSPPPVVIPPETNPDLAALIARIEMMEHDVDAMTPRIEQLEDFREHVKGS